MDPTSEDLEDFHAKATKLYSDLGTHRNFTKVEQAEALAQLAREWLRLSAALRDSAEIILPSLQQFDTAMAEILKATKQRTRSNVHQKHLLPFKSGFLDAVVLPLMRHEGSPAQAASRQLESVFDGLVSIDEAQYVSEAARCSSVKCHRAAIVMLWAATIARLHSQIQNVGFAAYNAAAAATVKKKGSPFNRVTATASVANLADLQLGRDFDIIVVGMELWSYDSQCFDELNRCLNIRNSAAHPGSFDPTSLDVRQFAEKIKRHVFENTAFQTV